MPMYFPFLNLTKTVVECLFLSLDAWSLDCTVFFLITEDPSTDFVKLVDTGCSHGSRTPNSESERNRREAFSCFWFFNYVPFTQESRNGCSLALPLLGMLSVCPQRDTRNGRAWRRWGVKLWFSEQKKLEEIIRNTYSVSIVCSGTLKSLFWGGLLPDYLKTVTFICQTPILPTLILFFQQKTWIQLTRCI